MGVKLYLESFEEIYHDTYSRVLKYIICNCSNIEDVNDLIQETYIELYKLLERKKIIELDDYCNYIIGIANKRIKKYYGRFYKVKEHLLNEIIENEESNFKVISDIDIESEIIEKLDAEKVWTYIKKKDNLVIKIFYLFYYSELKISQIAQELNITESKVKNILYRTIKDIKITIMKEGGNNV